MLFCPKSSLKFICENKIFIRWHKGILISRGSHVKTFQFSVRKERCEIIFFTFSPRQGEMIQTTDLVDLAVDRNQRMENGFRSILLLDPFLPFLFSFIYFLFMKVEKLAKTPCIQKKVASNSPHLCHWI